MIHSALLMQAFLARFAVHRPPAARMQSRQMASVAARPWRRRTSSTTGVRRLKIIQHQRLLPLRVVNVFLGCILNIRHVDNLLFTPLGRALDYTKFSYLLVPARSTPSRHVVSFINWCPPSFPLGQRVVRGGWKIYGNEAPRLEICFTVRTEFMICSVTDLSEIMFSIPTECMLSSLSVLTKRIIP